MGIRAKFSCRKCHFREKQKLVTCPGFCKMPNWQYFDADPDQKLYFDANPNPSPDTDSSIKAVQVNI